MSRKKYVVNKKSSKKDVKTITIEGYSLASKNHKFVIKGESVSNIVVTDTDLIEKLIEYKVDKKYKELIKKATEVLTEDDSSNGTGMLLDELEKFRQEIKIKYKEYLTHEKLNMMAKQLSIIKKEAEKRKIAIKEYLEINNKAK